MFLCLICASLTLTYTFNPNYTHTHTHTIFALLTVKKHTIEMEARVEKMTEGP